jgi:hypothetical protein
MDVKRLARIAAAGALLACLSSFVIAQGGRSSYDPAGGATPRKQREGFVDVTLKRINPADTDYGQCLGEVRSIALRQTVQNAYFWSNCVALCLLGCLFIIVVHQRHIQARCDASTTEMLAEFEHALLRSNRQLHESRGQNHSLKESVEHLRLLASCPVSSAAEIPQPETPPARTRATRVEDRPAATPRNGASKVPPNRSSAVANVKEPSLQIGLFKSEPELVAKINALSQQLAHFENENNQLRRQLNENGRRLEAEEEKNRSLKGQ